MKCIIYPQQNDKLAVVASAGTIESSIKDIPIGIPYTIVDSPLQIDNDYFDGYIYNNGKVKPNISICKEIHYNKFRQARKPILEKLDVEFMRALETGDTQKQQEIASKKQDLRDITNISLPDDIEGIKKVWPSVLNS